MYQHLCGDARELPLTFLQPIVDTRFVYPFQEMEPLASIEAGAGLIKKAYD